MNTLPPLPATFLEDRFVIQRIVVHVLARARSQATGRIGLVPNPGGIGTPAFGDDLTVVRLTHGGLAIDTGGTTTITKFAGATLASLATAAGADLAAEFSAGTDTPPVGNIDEPLRFDPATLTALGAWHALGWQILDATMARLPATASPARTQLWPEHFDVGTNVAVGPGDNDRANLGTSPGDNTHALPYLYLGPWDTDRPGDPAYWNAPFGAVLSYADLATTADPVAAGTEFLLTGLTYLS